MPGRGASFPRIETGLRHAEKAAQVAGSEKTAKWAENRARRQEEGRRGKNVARQTIYCKERPVPRRDSVEKGKVRRGNWASRARAKLKSL